MKLFIRLVLMLAGMGASQACLRAQTAPGTPGMIVATPASAVTSTNGIGPRIQFNTENYNAGTHLADDPIRYTFLVTNTGDEVLKLSNVHPSCGCTTIGETVPAATNSAGLFVPGATTSWTREIAPGKTGVIPLQILTSNFRGQINKTVTVTSNDRTRSNVVLQISGMVWVPIEITPPMASFSLMADSTNLNTQVIKIVNRTETPLMLSDPRSSTNAFTAVLKTNVPGQEFELTISAKLPPQLPPSLSATIIQGEISLKSSATNKNPLTITAFENVLPEITISPLSIQVPAGPLTRPFSSHVGLRENVTNFTLSDPVVNAPGVGVAMKVIQTNRQYYLDITFPVGFEVPPGRNIMLTVKTDNPLFPAILVPVTQVKSMAPPPPPVSAQATRPSQSMAAPPMAGVSAGLSNKLGGPRIKFNTEYHNAGTNRVGDLIRVDFTVTNTGDEKLVISDVKTSCNCTIVGGFGTNTTWTHEIAPGQTGIIPVQVNTRDLSRGQFNKTVTVTSDDRTRPNVVLQIGGFIWVPVEISPSFASFSVMPDATNLNKQVIKIVNRAETPLILSDPSSSTNLFSVVLKTNVPGQDYELTVSAKLPPYLPPSLSVTTIPGEISLKSSATNKNPLTIPAFENVFPEITISPSSISVPNGQLARPFTSHIVLRENVTNFTLSDPVVNAPGVGVAIKVLQTNRQYYLDLNFPAGFEVPPGRNTLFTIKTDNPRFPILSVPVSAVKGLVSATPPPGRANQGLAGAPTVRPMPPPPSPAASAAFSPNLGGPNIRFNTENYDAGTNIAGDLVHAIFTVTNTGKEPLILTSVNSGCSCTTIGGFGAYTTWTHEIAPGQTGVVPVQVNTSNLRGKLSKTVSVASNDKARPVVTLQVQVNVWLPVEITPTIASFNVTSDATSNSTQILKILNRMKTPLTLSDLVCSTNAFSAVLKTNVPGQEYELTVTALPPTSVPSVFGTTVVQGSLVLKSSSAEMNALVAASMSPLQVRVYETIHPEISVFPPFIQLPPGPLVYGSTNYISIRGNNEKLTLSGAAADVAGVEVSVTGTNGQYSLVVVFPKGYEMKPGQNGSVTVKTDNLRFTVLSIPVRPSAAIARRPQPPPPALSAALPPSIVNRSPANPTNAPVPGTNLPPRLNPLHP